MQQKTQGRCFIAVVTSAKRPVSIVFLLAASLFLGAAGVSFVVDWNGAFDRSQEELNNINLRDYDALNRATKQENAVWRFMRLETLLGAAFLVTGLALDPNKTSRANCKLPPRLMCDVAS